MVVHELRLAVHATPGAKRTEAAGVHGDALRVRLAAPPVDVTLPLFRVVLSPTITRPFYAVPRTSVARIASG